MRKHYFYCDMPQGYQITQQDEPVVSDGHIWLSEEEGNAYSDNPKNPQSDRKNLNDPFVSLMDYPNNP